MKGYIARIDVFIKASREAVWHALITPEIVEKYFYGTKLSSSWEIGAPIIFRGEWNGTSYEDKGTILQFEPNSKLVYNYWSSMSGLPDTPEFYQLLTYELTEVENGVRQASRKRIWTVMKEENMQKPLGCQFLRD